MSAGMPMTRRERPVKPRVPVTVVMRSCCRHHRQIVCFPTLPGYRHTDCPEAETFTAAWTEANS